MHHLPFITGASLHYGTQIWPSIKSMNFMAWPVIYRQVELVCDFCFRLVFVCWFDFVFMLKLQVSHLEDGWGDQHYILSCMKLSNVYTLHFTHIFTPSSFFRDSRVLHQNLLVASASCCVSLRFPTTEETVRSGFSLLQTILRSLEVEDYKPLKWWNPLSSCCFMLGLEYDSVRWLEPLPH